MPAGEDGLIMGVDVARNGFTETSDIECAGFTKFGGRFVDWLAGRFDETVDTAGSPVTIVTLF